MVREKSEPPGKKTAVVSDVFLGGPSKYSNTGEFYGGCFGTGKIRAI